MQSKQQQQELIIIHIKVVENMDRKKLLKERPCNLERNRN